MPQKEGKVLSKKYRGKGKRGFEITVFRLSRGSMKEKKEVVPRRVAKRKKKVPQLLLLIATERKKKKGRGRHGSEKGPPVLAI